MDATNDGNGARLEICMSKVVYLPTSYYQLRLFYICLHSEGLAKTSEFTVITISIGTDSLGKQWRLFRISSVYHSSSSF